MSDRQDHKVFPLLEKPCDKCRGRGWYSFGGGEKIAARFAMARDTSQRNSARAFLR